MSVGLDEAQSTTFDPKERLRKQARTGLRSARILAPSFRQMQILQAISGLAFVYALSWEHAGLAWWGVSLGVYFLTGCLGLTVTMHRALTHQAFKLPRSLEILFTLFGAAGGSGSSIAWTAMHRAHHANVDKAEDPHAPAKLGWWLVFSVYDYDFNPRHAKDLLRDKFHLFLHRYYVAFLAIWGLGLAAVDFRLCIYVFLVPAFVQITVSNLTSLLTHSHGYRTFETQDQSANNPLIALLGWGEGWHNNHHAAPLRWSFQRRWWEIDPGAISISALIALGLVRV
jgi:fatty-acid desaturase